MTGYTALSVTESTADRLYELKDRKQTWDELMNEMADAYEESEDS